jgi:hypothetical protein
MPASRDGSLDRIADAAIPLLDALVSIGHGTTPQKLAPNLHKFSEQEIQGVYRAIRERRDMRHFLSRPIEAKSIEAALHVFAEKGPQAAVIDDFVKAAGVSRGTFYNYFRSTDGLLVATQTWLSDDLIKSIEDALVGITDPITRFGMNIRLWMKRAVLKI